jgi:hypothetical protein
MGWLECYVEDCEMDAVRKILADFDQRHVRWDRDAVLFAAFRAAAFRDYEIFEVIDMLLKRGANINARTAAGTTCFDEFVKSFVDYCLQTDLQEWCDCCDDGGGCGPECPTHLDAVAQTLDDGGFCWTGAKEAADAHFARADEEYSQRQCQLRDEMRVLKPDDTPHSALSWRADEEYTRLWEWWADIGTEASLLDHVYGEFYEHFSKVWA